MNVIAFPPPLQRIERCPQESQLWALLKIRLRHSHQAYVSPETLTNLTDVFMYDLLDLIIHNTISE